MSTPIFVEPTPKLKFSERLEIAKQAAKWCEKHKCPTSPFNIITALNALGFKIKMETDE